MRSFLILAGVLFSAFIVFIIVKNEIAERRDHERFIRNLRKINRGYYGDNPKSVRDIRESKSPQHNPFGNIR